MQQQVGAGEVSRHRRAGVETGVGNVVRRGHAAGRDGGADGGDAGPLHCGIGGIGSDHRGERAALAHGLAPARVAVSSPPWLQTTTMHYRDARVDPGRRRAYADNRWTGPGTSDKYPRAIYSYSGWNGKNSTMYLTDGSFIRLRSVTLGYTFPQRLVSKIHLKGLRVYAQGDNVFLCSRYPGWDPETSVNLDPRFYGEDALAGWKQVVDAVHAEGGKIVPQLWHVGSAKGPAQLGKVDSPSGLSKPGGEPFTEPMTDADIADTIAATASEGSFDLLMMGSHGHGTLGNLVMGSVATRVLAHCQTPVLLVR